MLGFKRFVTNITSNVHQNAHIHMHNYCSLSVVCFAAECALKVALCVVCVDVIDEIVSMFKTTAAKIALVLTAV
jgi:hypothetical protein